MSTMYRYALPVELTEWKFEGAVETRFTWEYDDEREGLLQLYDKGKKQQWDAALRIADRGYVIVHGKIAFAGNSVDELNNNDLIRKFYLGL